MGWSEPVATNALVEDEAIEVVFKMNQKHIPLARNYWFFEPLLYPKNFPYLPPSSFPPTSPFLPPT